MDNKSMIHLRRLGEKRDGVVYARPEDYASFPQLARTDDQLVLPFQVQDLAKLRAIPEHPHYHEIGYGWYLYQAESCDGGRTWSEPVQLALWGHPPCLLRLAGGNILLVYGHRRPPWDIRAILSRDDGRTWDMTTLRTVHTFDPGHYDMGYPVATQLDDGSIVCTFYGYSTPDVGEKIPHGIFVSVFDEMWLTDGRCR